MDQKKLSSNCSHQKKKENTFWPTHMSQLLRKYSINMWSIRRLHVPSVGLTSSPISPHTHSYSASLLSWRLHNSVIRLWGPDKLSPLNEVLSFLVGNVIGPRKVIFLSAPTHKERNLVINLPASLALDYRLQKTFFPHNVSFGTFLRQFNKQDFFFF